LINTGYCEARVIFDIATYSSVDPETLPPYNCGYMGDFLDGLRAGANVSSSE
jgi:hypothetical protein